MKNKPIIFSHRGNTEKFVENTIEASQQHIREGAQGLEIDVRACGSGELVVFHDFSLKRMYNRPGFVGRTQLSDLRAMPYFHRGTESKYQILTLDEYLDHFKDQHPINIDAKTIHFFDFEFADKLISIIKNHNLTETVWISCFNPFLLQIIKLKSNEIKTGYLFQRSPFLHTTYDLGVFTDAWHPSFELLNKNFVRTARKRKKEIYVWTANDESSLKNSVELGVDGIITDDVVSAKKLLDTYF